MRVPRERVFRVKLVTPHGKYLLRYTRRQKNAAYMALHAWASNPRLGFTWLNCAIMAQYVREQCEGREYRTVVRVVAG